MVRLSILMFLQFWIWGSWHISVSLYMMENGMGDVRYYAYTAGPLAAIIAPFFTGLFADRFFNTEKVLAGLFLLGGGFMLLLAKPEQQETVKQALNDLLHVPFRFESVGSQIIHYDPPDERQVP